MNEPGSASSFVPQHVLEGLGSLEPADADELPFGVIRVDDDGVVELYNRWESEMAKIPQDMAIGRSFFREIAPCTDNRLLSAKFFRGVFTESLDLIIDFTFSYRVMPTMVQLHLYRHRPSGTNWIFVKMADSQP